MSDPFDPPEPNAAPPAAAEDESRLEDEPFPWDADVEPDDPDVPRGRHDAFTEAKKNLFLKALVKTGCIADACRRTGIARRTVYRHQQDSRFFDDCSVALRMAGTPMEITAWKRAVEGVEEEVVVGGKVQVRRRYSEGLLRLLLQGSNPAKYGPRPGFKRKRLLKAERKQMEREIRAELKAQQEEKSCSFDDAIVALESKLEALGRRTAPERLAAGWTKSPDGHWVPPGYGPIPGYAPLPGASDADIAPPDSM